MLLSDTDPLSLRAPIVGVWVSGGGGGGADSITTRVQHARPPSPFQHPYTYPACLRFLMLLTARGGQQQQRSSVAAHRGTVAAAMGPLKAPRAKEDGSPPAAASAGAFLVLHLLGGVSGGTPSFFEGSATGPDGHGSRAGAASAGFEQLDFSADVDVVVKEEGMVVEGGRKRRGREMSGAGGSSSGSSGGGRTVVIGRLRRVSDPAFAQPFQRAQQQVSTSMR